ncbi:MAG: asparagine synthase (glutamine-hydrolyzing) [Sandaracinus sp.]|nr:asparagine synthase (glutamine-hydrolyzing) [Sandaracinus sp.]
MCGVVASIGPPAALEAPMRRAMDAMAHRGPDGEGLVSSSERRVWLGHRRLALVDVEGGAQPLQNEAGDVVAVVNGEIYDDARLRRELEARGHVFATRSDSELLVHLYEEHGDACVEHVRGELAFVLYDARRDRLLAGRDRFGVKPLWWARHEGRVVIASTLAALRALGVPMAWDRSALFHVVAHQYLPPSRSLVHGVHSVPPGHVLLVEAGRVATRAYHVLRPRVVPAEPEEARAEVRRHLEEAVRLRLRSDVPVGTYLSGGLDSTAVVALAARERPRLPTFGVSFARAPWDEGSLAAESAEALGVPFEPVPVSQRDLVDGLADAVRFAEGLAINGQLVAKHRLALAARAAGVRAVLTGEGADEAFLGYPHLRLDHYGEDALRTSDAITRGVMVPRVGDRISLPLDAVTHAMGFAPAFVRAKAAFGARLLELLRPELREGFGDPFEALFDELVVPEGSEVERSAWLWTKLALGGYIVRTLGDGTEMAASIEGRPPFLDHVLFEHAWSLPVALRLDADGREKAVLRDAMRDVVPETIRTRHKQPFLAPPVLVDVYDDARALLEEVADHVPFVERAALTRFLDAMASADDDTRAAADPVWTTLASAGCLGRALGMTEVRG